MAYHVWIFRKKSDRSGTSSAKHREGGCGRQTGKLVDTEYIGDAKSSLRKERLLNLITKIRRWRNRRIYTNSHDASIEFEYTAHMSFSMWLVFYRDRDMLTLRLTEHQGEIQVYKSAPAVRII